MTDKEQIEEMARSCCSRTYETCKECIKESEKVFGKIDLDDCECYFYASRFFNKGYHKIVWHKVAEGDLPQKQGLYLCHVHIYAFDENGNEIGGYGYRVEPFVGTFDSLNASVVAWTELPKYKE